MDINIDESAITRLKELKVDEGNPDLLFRIFVQGGGCSGFSYGFTFDDTKNDDDFDLKFDDLTIVIDSMSAMYLTGAHVKYEENLMGSSFVINNPNAVSTCGCGSSFSI